MFVQVSIVIVFTSVVKVSTHLPSITRYSIIQAFLISNRPAVAPHPLFTRTRDIGQAMHATHICIVVNTLNVLETYITIPQ